MKYDLDFFKNHPNVQGREVVMVVQTGSVNYNLETNDSDLDFQVFVMPNFNDFYNRTLYASEYQSKEVDFKVNDVRHLALQLTKMNPNFLDVLFSKNVLYVHPGLQFLFEERELLARADLPRLFRSSKGLLHTTLNRVLKKDDPLFYDSKQHSHAERITRLLYDYRLNLSFSTEEERPYFKALRAGHRYLLRMKKGLLLVGKNQVPYSELTDEEKEKHMEWVRLDVSELPKKMMTLEASFSESDVNTEYLDDVANRVKEFVASHVKL